MAKKLNIKKKCSDNDKKVKRIIDPINEQAVLKSIEDSFSEAGFAVLEKHVYPNMSENDLKKLA